MATSYTQNVTGLAHSAFYETNMNNLEEGTELTFERMKDNKFDPLAIKVLCRGEHLGWIPMKSGKERNIVQKLMAEGMDKEGKVYKGKVLLHDLNRNIFNRLTIAIEEA